MDVTPPPPPSALVATGQNNEWRVWLSDGHWWIAEAGRAPIVAADLGHKLTRRGRVMGARTTDGGIVSITLAHGLCRIAGAARPASYLATLRIEGRTLRGCYLGIPPGERPDLD